MAKPSFWEVARRPKWIAGLALALLVAVVFSLLMQWQLSRTFNEVGVSIEESAPVALEDLISPNQPITSPVYDRLVTFEGELNPANSYIVASRLQLLPSGETAEGYWLISNAWVNSASMTLAIGFSQDLEQIRDAKTNLENQEISILGYLEPSEPVRDRVDGALGSVSLAQLINFYSQEDLASYPAYVIVKSGLDTGLEPITIGIRQQAIEVNWLTAFYAIEWAFFALAAFYLWWRMVSDQRVRESEGII
ncbi:MAG: hypothetical protein RL068_87 [Actinomycetota bacterium]|jgi:cytochrome oxidase assembly protein ShyY1